MTPPRITFKLPAAIAMIALACTAAISLDSFAADPPAKQDSDAMQLPPGMTEADMKAMMAADRTVIRMFSADALGKEFMNMEVTYTQNAVAVSK